MLVKSNFSSGLNTLIAVQLEAPLNANAGDYIVLSEDQKKFLVLAPDMFNLLFSATGEPEKTKHASATGEPKKTKRARRHCANGFSIQENILLVFALDTDAQYAKELTYHTISKVLKQPLEKISPRISELISANQLSVVTKAGRRPTTVHDRLLNITEEGIVRLKHIQNRGARK